jgi:hypothetical protein
VDIHPLPEWAWGKDLPKEVVADIIDMADTCNEACLIADEAQLIYRRSGARLRPEREIGRLPKHHLNMLADWRLAATNYYGRLLTAYVNEAATFVVSVVPLAESLLQHAELKQISELSEPAFNHLLGTDAVDIPLVQISTDWSDAVKSTMNLETRERINAELTHHRQLAVTAMEGFKAHRSTTDLDHGNHTIPDTSRTWIEVDGAALGASLHSYAAGCLWLIADITAESGQAGR